MVLLFLAATGVFLGFTHFWLAGTSVLVGLFIWQKWYFRIHWIPLSLGGLFAIAGIWSSDPLAGLLWFCNAQVLFALWHTPINKRGLYKWLFVLTSLLMIAGFFEVVWLRDYRPEVIVKDASILGFSGMAVMHPLTGISGSRTAVAGIWLFAALTTRKRLLFLAIVATAFLFVAPLVGVTDFFRFTPDGIENAASLRSDLIVEAETVSIPWYGLGYHSYVLETGMQRPHNVFYLAAYELGYLSILFWLLIAFGFAYVPWRVRLLIFPILFVTEEWFSRPEAQFVFFGLVLSTYYWIPRFNLSALIRARIEEQRRDVPASS